VVDKADPTPQLKRSALGVAFALLYGPIVWALHLAFVYGLHGIVCERQGTPAPLVDVEVVPDLIVAATIVALGLLALPFFVPAVWANTRDKHPDSSESQFYGTSTALLSLLSAAGVIWAGFGTLIFEVCTVTQ
jgi:hypothetical protein